MKVVFRQPNSEELSGVLLNRGGKATGQYRDFWNIDCNGSKKCLDFRSMDYVKAVPDQGEEHAFVVLIPRHLHNSENCFEAKRKEIENLKCHNVFEEVPDQGQKTIGTNWILAEKVKDGKTFVKARLCARGDQEVDKQNIRTDSPTIDKSNIKLILLTAAKNNWQVKTSDVSCAFLQGAEIDREVYVKPPREARVRNTLWKMNKSIYGLDDASRNWYLSLHETLTALGCVVSKFDSALFLYFHEGALHGILGTHVDDLLHTGDSVFEDNVISKLKSTYIFGTEEEEDFRYVGMNVQRFDNHITVNQDHYIKALEVPDMTPFADLSPDEILEEKSQGIFRSCVGKIGWLCAHSRPDLSFDYIDLSSKFGKATVKDFRNVSKKFQKLKADTTIMKIPDMGDVKDWILLGYGDVGMRSLPGTINSCGGQVVILKNCVSN